MPKTISGDPGSVRLAAGRRAEASVTSPSQLLGRSDSTAKKPTARAIAHCTDQRECPDNDEAKQ
jgi:hypothetical protein